jgi:hypothetical protein
MKSSAWRRLAALPVLVLAGMTVLAPPANAKPSVGVTPDTAIVLPGATSAEGIAKGRGNTFYAGDLFAGNIYRGDVATQTAELFIDVPDGRQALGMTFDERNDLLFVAGGSTGQAYVYDTTDGSTVTTFQFGPAGTTLVNDVTLTRTGAWFTDSAQAQLYFVPVANDGTLGAFTTLVLSGPAADTGDPFNLNGIVATPNGQTLIVAHTGNGQLYTVNPVTGGSALITGISVPNVDGLVLRGRQLWAVQNLASNQVSRIRLARDLSSGEVVDVITSSLFHEPSTAALFGNILAVVNTHFGTGVPPTADEYEVVLVSAY